MLTFRYSDILDLTLTLEVWESKFYFGLTVVMDKQNSGNENNESKCIEFCIKDKNLYSFDGRTPTMVDSMMDLVHFLHGYLYGLYNVYGCIPDLDGCECGEVLSHVFSSSL